ncbi:hypothetical protein GBA52_013222 [Prunus armeniaca]|nr:hypothetical protein GBA52_013222 [Prunus armeniaca]
MAAKAESKEREVKPLSARNDQYGGVIADINGPCYLFIISYLLNCALEAAERVNLVEAAVKVKLRGEDIFAAAVTEVKEETGIDSEFVEVLAFRQSHKSFFQKSDLFFVCMLRPLSFDIQKQEQEIEAAKWMPFEEYATQPFVQKYELLKYIHDICKAKMDGKYTGFSPVPSTSYSVQKSYLYLNTSTAPRRESKL